MNEQELNKKLALHYHIVEQREVTNIGLEGEEYGDRAYFMVENGERISHDLIGDAKFPPLTQFLDACFKWLVPEHISEITFMYASNCVSCDIEDLEGNFFEGHVNVESIEEAWTKSAPALCLAFEKLIDGEK